MFGVQYAYVSYLFAKEQERLVRKSVEDEAGARTAPSTSAALVENVRKDTAKDAKVDPDLKERDAAVPRRGSGLRPLPAGRGGDRQPTRPSARCREAIGVGCDVPLPLKHARLLDVKGILDKRQLIDLALANRPDLLAASINVQVSDLEVKAQGSRNSLTVRTFASGADLHSVPLPAGRYDQEYRPAVVGPGRCRPFLAGKKCDRVAHLRATLAKPGRLGQPTRRGRSSILEVEQIFLRHEEAAAKAASLDQAAVKLKTVIHGKPEVQDKDKPGYVKGIEGASQRFKKRHRWRGQKPSPPSTTCSNPASSARRSIAQANEARYQQLIALITPRTRPPVPGLPAPDLSGATKSRTG